jgi:mono/diheme cytochrome c family protein
MKKFLSTATVSVVLVAASAALMSCNNATYEPGKSNAGSTSGSTLSKADQLSRGEYLVTSIAGCGNCHTPKGPNGEIAELTLAGGFPFVEEGFSAYSSNITPSAKTGIGDWSLDQIVTAIRDGIRPDGSLIGPPMPFAVYRHISDDDAYAIAAYIMSLDPIENEVEPSEYNIPLPPAYGPKVEIVAGVEEGPTAEYGAYLAGPVGHCMECHTPLDESGQMMLDQAGMGGNEFHGPWGVAISRDIRAGSSKIGIGAWSDEEIINAITQGTRADGTPLNPPMGYHYYERMTDSDLQALVAFLRTLPAK